MTISNKSCFSLISQKGKNQVKQSDTNSILYMNPAVMKTLKYRKDDLIVLHTESGQVLFRCWPSASLEESNLKLRSANLFNEQLEGPIYCDHYRKLLVAADTIILNCDNYKAFMDSEYFRQFMQAQLQSVYVRKNLRFTLFYLGYPCSFSVKNIYCQDADKLMCEENLNNICSNISSLDISDTRENLDDEPSFMCSTPKNSNQNVHKKKKKKTVNAETEFVTKTEQFYVMHGETKIIIKCPQTLQTSNQDQFTLQNIGGLKEQIKEMKSLIDSIYNQDLSPIKQCHGVILVGAAGTGKSAIVRAIKNELGLPLFKLNDALSDRQTAERELQRLHREAIENSPCILFLDKIDDLCQSDSSQRNSQVALLSAVIHDLLRSTNDVLVISTAHSIATVDISLRKPGALEKEIYFEMPSIEDKKEILSKIMGSYHNNMSRSQIMQIAEKTNGFSGGDLERLCSETYISTQCLDVDKCISFEDLKNTLKDIKPSSMREFIIEKPKVKWTDIGGMHDVKAAVKEMVEWPHTRAEQFKKLKITPSRGILLYGPPGCSKTMIAKALASEGNLNFISVKGPELFNKFVGESEKAISSLFKKARSAAPCVIFCDEIDSMAKTRGSTSGNSNVAERVLTQLLVEIDGIDVLQRGVNIIAATNKPDMIDASFLRPGRFDQRIYVPLPDYDTRKEIFEAKIKNMPCASDIDIPYLVKATEGYSGAEITAVCEEAGKSGIKDYITSGLTTLKMLHFLTALKHVVPKTPKEMLVSYENFNKRMSN